MGPVGLFENYQPAMKTTNEEPSIMEQDASPSRRLGVSQRCFTSRGQDADVTVLVVTYNNAHTVEQLVSSLRDETRNLSLRLVIADNGSTDSTLELLAKHPDVVTVSTGGNLGYAGGLNFVMHFSAGSEAVLVLNPDLSVGPNAVADLLGRMRQSGAGIVVPQLLNSDGSIYVSLRREPGILTALGDAFCGARFTGRPDWASELDYDPKSYRYAHQVAWATGAALLIRGSLAERIGPWDEQFFLYSEEVDYFRRARESGESIWYEPAARMTHHMGGSGSSTALNALMAVNRIKYIRKYHGKLYASSFRSVVLLAEGLRAFKTSRRGIFMTVMDEGSWGSLPRPSTVLQQPISLAEFPSGSIIIPAHNEEAVIARTLRTLEELAGSGAVEIIVACNGCTDRTALIASSFAGVEVIEVRTASKVAALNAADQAATRWPRVYLDADIEMSPQALGMVLDRLSQGNVLAARPAFEYDDSQATAPVQAFYRARRRIPSSSQALWGAGVYGLTKDGHARFGEFPTLTADDLFIDQQFTPSEKTVVNTPPVRVATPRNAKSLSAILRRNYRGQAEFVKLDPGRRDCDDDSTLLRSNPVADSRRTARELLGSVHDPMSLLDSVFYAGFVTTARMMAAKAAKKPTPVWERDESSRLAHPESHVVS